MAKLIYEKPIISKIVITNNKYGMVPRIRTISEIDGHKIHDLLSKYGSPLYIISEKTLRDTLHKFKEAFVHRYPKVVFAWSYKTNYLDAVCRTFHSEGWWAEVVSGFEYEKAIQNGVDGSKIIFNGPYKTDQDLIRAIEDKSLIHIDHFDELYNIIRLADKTKERPRVAIRVNMDTGIYPQWDRFGFNYDNGEAWLAITKIMTSGKLDLIGLHTHIGTYIMSPNPYTVAVSKLLNLAQKLRDRFDHKIKYIDLGGGFASKNTLKGAYLPGKDTCPSFDEYAENITNAILNSDAVDYNDLPTLILETGRALIDDAGYILGTVVANKRLADGRRAMIIDIGLNNLFTSFWYNHDILPVDPPSEFTEDTTIYGPLCMNIDVIHPAIQFPPMNPGDHVVIERTGAYNMTQWLQFIMYRPNVVMIDTQGDTHIIRKKEDIEVFNRQEQVPEHLQNWKSEDE